MWDFHNSLSPPHDYSAAPWGWVLQLRPTSFFYDSPAGCGADSCSQAITSVGNPMLWWGGTLALLLVFAMWLWWNDGRAGLILAAIGAGWLPRSEERRVGKECSVLWSTDNYTRKKQS